MTLPEFLRRIKESVKLFKQYPDLAQQCAEQIQKELDEHMAGHPL